MVVFDDGSEWTVAQALALPPVRGFLPSTLIDWPGRIAAILFLPGCNLRCGYCHSAELLSTGPNDEEIPFAQVRKYLAEKRDWVDGVVICGGEPTTQPRLPNLCQVLKDFDVGVKLDTNGTRPDVVARLIDNGLVDAVSLDLKTTLDHRMLTLARAKVDLDAIEQTIDILLDASVEADEHPNPVEVEFRTTCCPACVDEEVIETLARRIGPDAARPEGSDYVLQRFNPDHCLDPGYRHVEPYSATEMEELLTAARAVNPRTRLRNG